MDSAEGVGRKWLQLIGFRPKPYGENGYTLYPFG